MVKGDLLIRRRLVGSEDTADDASAWRGASHVRKLFVAESLDDVVEVGGGRDGEASEEDGSGSVEEGVEIGFVGGDCLCEEWERRSREWERR